MWRAQLRGIKYYVAWGAAPTGPLFLLLSRAPAGPKPDVCRRTGTAEGVLSGCGRASGVSKCVSPSARAVACEAAQRRVSAGHLVHVSRARRRRADLGRRLRTGRLGRPLGRPWRRCVWSCGIRPDTDLRGLRLRVAAHKRQPGLDRLATAYPVRRPVGPRVQHSRRSTWVGLFPTARRPPTL
jgi:hypothetical protein